MKNLIKGALLLLAVAGIAYAAYWLGSRKSAPKDSVVKNAAVKQAETEATKINNDVMANGIQKTVYKMVKDQSAIDNIKADLLDTIVALNIERSKVRQVLVVNTSLSFKVQALEKKVSEFETTYSHKDSNLWMTVTVPKDSLKPAFAQGGYDADLVIAQHNKGNIFTGPQWYADIYSNDIRWTNKGLRTLTFKQKQPFFTADIQATAEYNLKTQSFNSGPSLNIGLGRIEIRGKYLYDPFERNWTGTISGGYMLLRK